MVGVRERGGRRRGEGWGVSNERRDKHATCSVPSAAWPSLSLTRSSARSAHYLSYPIHLAKPEPHQVLGALYPLSVLYCAACFPRGGRVCAPSLLSGCTVSIGLVGLGAGVAVVVGVYGPIA